MPWKRWVTGRKRDPVEVFETAIRNVAPAVEVKPKRVGGSTYQVPIDVTQERGIALAMRWLIQFARSRNGRSMAEKLANELLDAYNGQGSAVRRKGRNTPHGGGQSRVCAFPLS